MVLLFQPAEEGPGGALPMIEAGALDDPHVDAVTMLHVDTRLATGSIAINPGPVNAAADELFVTIHGIGGHGGYPHKGVDAIPAAAATVLALQNIAARETDPLASIVVSIGTIEGGYRNNVIADKVRMTGTIRTHDPELRAAVEARVRRIVDGVAAAYNTRGEVEIVYGYPPVVNHAGLAQSFAGYVHTTAGIPVVRLPATMGAEDFAYFAQRVPGVMVRSDRQRRDRDGAQRTAPGSGSTRARSRPGSHAPGVRRGAGQRRDPLYLVGARARPKILWSRRATLRTVEDTCDGNLTARRGGSPLACDLAEPRCLDSAATAFALVRGRSGRSGYRS